MNDHVGSLGADVDDAGRYAAIEPAERAYEHDVLFSHII